jgi:replicative DNA helicase
MAFGTHNRQAKAAGGDVRDRKVPSDVAAEQALIGSVALLPSVLADVSLIVTASDFYDDANREIFAAMVALTDCGKPIDDALLADRLRPVLGRYFDGDTGKGLAYLSQAINAVPNAAHAKHYAGIVREKSRLRKIITGCTVALGDAYGQLPADDVLGSLEQSLTTDERSGSEARPISDVWASVIDSHRKSLGKGEPPALLSGLPGADRVGFVFVGGELSVLAARPTVGKTSLATQIAMHHAGRGRPVLFASLEMNEQALGSRVLLAAAGLNHQSVRTRGVTQSDIDQLQIAKDAQGDLPLYVWAPGRVKVGAIRAMAAAVKAKHGLRLLIVDYTSWIIPDDPRAHRRDQIGEIVKALRGLGQRLDIPVLLLHQLNREGAGERPQLTHLRESGCVEEDADIVAFLHPAGPQNVTLIVEKSRQGAKGDAPLVWHPEQTRFEDTSMGQQWNAPPESDDNPYQRQAF